MGRQAAASISCTMETPLTPTAAVRVGGVDVVLIANRTQATGLELFTNLGIDPNCNTHTDPGPYWNWTRYMQLVNPTSTWPPSMSCTICPPPL